MDTKSYPVTHRREVLVGGVKCIHEVSDTDECFKHRLCVGGSLGEWTSYEWFAIAELNGRKFYACQDNWQPMFPPIFEAVEPV